jgi:hypothetical protein
MSKKRVRDQLTVSSASSVEEVCFWAEKTLGLSHKSVSILREEEIKGTNLLNLTVKKLRRWGMPEGPIETLMDAVALLCELPGEDFLYACGAKP